MKAKLFTHLDLDGVFSAMLLKLYLRKDLDHAYCDYSNVNNKIKYFINSKEYKKYDKLFITDISVNEEVAKLINDKTSELEVVLLDHHNTAMWLDNKYSWAKVVVDIEEGKAACGAYLTHEYLKEQEDFHNRYWSSMDGIVEKVRRYDTWEWTNIYNDEFPNKLNTLFFILGRDRFVDKFIDKLAVDRTINFDGTDKLLLELEREKIDNYINSLNYNLHKLNLTIGTTKYSTGLVFADRYTSEAGNKLCELNTDMDFVILINTQSGLSFRTNKDNIDLGKVASHFGGGGHSKAAGAGMDRSIAYKAARQLVRRLLKANK